MYETANYGLWVHKCVLENISVGLSRKETIALTVYLSHAIALDCIDSSFKKVSM